MELNFIKCGDYYIPDIKLKNPNIRLGKWGRMRKEYLRLANPVLFSDMVLNAEALNHPFDEPKQWEIREINEIMNNSIEGWRPFSNPRSFAKYGRQRGWERIPPPDNEPSATGSNLTDGFRELTEEEARQMELPF